MNTACTSLLGKKDFSSFCRTRSETRNRVCKITEAGWTNDTPDGHVTTWRFRISADRYLHGMVRAIVGTLLQIGRGARRVEDLSEIIAACDRREAGPAADPRGLVLHHVAYG